jgi:hypothetical protein
MADIVSRLVMPTNYELPNNGMKFIKRAGVSKNMVKEFIIACLSQLETDKRQVTSVNVGYYKDPEEIGLEYLRIVFVITGMDRKDILRYENDFFSKYYPVILNQAVSTSSKAKKETLISLFNNYVMVWFDWSG